MMTIIGGLIQQYCGKPCYNVCILGLQKTGKTSFSNSIKNIKATPSNNLSTSTYKPTVGLNITRYSPKLHPLQLWDLGGKHQLRKIWENYYPQSHGLIFIIDERVIEGVEVMKAVLQHQEMCRIPLLVLIKTETLKSQFQSLLPHAPELLADRAYLIQVYSPQIALSPVKIHEILQWMYEQISKLHNWVKKE